jgi:hypothetical protein
MAAQGILDIIDLVTFVIEHPILTIFIALGFLILLGSVGVL